MIIGSPSQKICPIGLRLGNIFRQPTDSCSTSMNIRGRHSKERLLAVFRYMNQQSYKNPINMAEKNVFLNGYKLNQLYDSTIRELISYCEGDLRQIDTIFGIYGLAEYAQVAPNKLIKRTSNVKEVPFVQEDTFSKIFYNYLLNNETGTTYGIYRRFGKMGADLYESLSIMELVEDRQSMYKITNLGRSHLESYLTINSKNFKHELDKYFAMQPVFPYNENRRRGDNEFRKGKID